ncbi:MAG: hypothetical protein V7785_23380 [Bermanella sp.]
MTNEEVLNKAKSAFKILLLVNLFFAIGVLTALLVFKEKEIATTLFIFFPVELLMFIVFFVPVFIYNLVKGRGIKYSLSKGILAVGDFYIYFSPQ